MRSDQPELPIAYGLTGGIGSGKSTVTELLRARGVAVIDADAIVRQLQEPGQPVFLAMVDRWGEGVLHEDGSLHRGAVAEIVFRDAHELAALNEMVHPAVAAEATRRQRELAAAGETLVVLDIPLLVDVNGVVDEGRYGYLAGVIVVDVSVETAIERLVASRELSRGAIAERMAGQASRDARLAAADYVIDNSGSLEDLSSAVDALLDWIRAGHPGAPR